jgi:hypothetical protein
MTDDPTGVSPSFRYAHRRIFDLMNKLRAKGICPCCAGRAAAEHAAILCEETMGSKLAAEFLSAMAEETRQHNRPGPDDPSHH